MQQMSADRGKSGKTYIEYVQMAGGIDPELTAGRGVRIFDREGNRHGPERIIQPEDKIYVPKNSFNYVFAQRYGPVIVTTAAIVSLILDLTYIIDYFK